MHLQVQNLAQYKIDYIFSFLYFARLFGCGGNLKMDQLQMLMIHGGAKDFSETFNKIWSLNFCKTNRVQPFLYQNELLYCCGHLELH